MEHRKAPAFTWKAASSETPLSISIPPRQTPIGTTEEDHSIIPALRRNQVVSGILSPTRSLLTGRMATTAWRRLRPALMPAPTKHGWSAPKTLMGIQELAMGRLI